MTILQEKMLLIRALLDLEDNNLIQQIKKILFTKNINKPTILEKRATEASLSLALEPIPDFISIESLKQEQNYKPENVMLAFSGWQEEKWHQNETEQALLHSID